MLYNKTILIIASVVLLGSCRNPGLLGTDEPEPSLTQWVFVDSTEHNTCAIDSRHQGYCWGSGLGNLPRKIPFMEDISAVRIANVNGDIFYVIKRDGSFRRVTRNKDQWFEESFAEVPFVQSMSRDTFLINVQSSQGTCVVDPAGGVWCFRESSGSLALPTISRVEGLPPVVQVDTMGSHSCALTEEGAVWCWGYNGSGQLGRDPADGTEHPALVEGLPPMTGLSTSSRKTCAHTEQGDLYCWGRLHEWTVYICPDGEPCDKPEDPDLWFYWWSHLIDIQYFHVDSYQPWQLPLVFINRISTTAALDDVGSIWKFGEKQGEAPMRVFPGFQNVVHLSTFWSHANGCLIRSDHSLWCWGHGGTRFGIGEVEPYCDPQSCWFYSAVPLRVHEPVD